MEVSFWLSARVPGRLRLLCWPARYPVGIQPKEVARSAGHQVPGEVDSKSRATQTSGPAGPLVWVFENGMPLTCQATGRGPFAQA